MYNPVLTIVGMAIGTDQLCARLCVQLGLPFAAYVPFAGQESRWPAEAQRAYKHLCGQACEVCVISPGGYSAGKMHARNEAIVKHCTLLIAVWDGRKDGGTYACLRYADNKAGRRHIIINPRNVDPVEDGGYQYYLQHMRKNMGMRAYVLGIGTYKRDIADCLEYPVEHYEDTLDGTIVFTQLFDCNTSDASRQLADALGTEPWDFNRHEIRYDQCNHAKLYELSGRLEGGTYETEQFKRLSAAGFRFYYRPEG